MFFIPQLLYNILLLCCLVGGSPTMPNNNDDNNSNNAENELHEAGSNRPACASCKHQRKKCIEGDCALWRHFPPSKMDEFLAVHKVFGISNVTKKLKSLDNVAQQDEAIKSFLWEARLWQEDPVHGPLGEYRKLEQKLKEKRRNKQLQNVPLQDVPQVPPPTPSEASRYLPTSAVDQNMTAPIANNSMHPLAVNQSMVAPIANNSMNPLAVDQTMVAPIANNSMHPLAVDQSMVAPIANNSMHPLVVDQSMLAPIANNSMHTYNQQDYNMLNSTVPNYTNPLPQHGHGGETQGTTGNSHNMINVSNYTNPLPQHGHGGEAQGTTSNSHNMINVGGGNNRFGYGNLPSHYNRPIEQVRNGLIPRQPGVQGSVHQVQLHQQRYPPSYNNMDLGQGRRRKEQSDQFVSPSFDGRNVRGRGIGPIGTASSALAGPIIGHGPMISSNSSGPFVDSSAANAMTMVRPSVTGRHVEDGRNQRSENLAAVPQNFTNSNHPNLPGGHKQPDLENRDASNYIRF